jgi:hypothetical protein
MKQMLALTLLQHYHTASADGCKLNLKGKPFWSAKNRLQEVFQVPSQVYEAVRFNESWLPLQG